MTSRLLEHARSNAVAYAALGLAMLALSGGAYAAFSIPPHSVGARQIMNHSIAPRKFDPRAIGGFVRHVATVDQHGKILSSSSRAHENGVPIDGDYLINWGDTFSRSCVPLVSVLGNTGLLGAPVGFADARVISGH